MSKLKTILRQFCAVNPLVSAPVVHKAWRKKVFFVKKS